jgi:predicted P-loop ATPase
MSDAWAITRTPLQNAARDLTPESATWERLGELFTPRPGPKDSGAFIPARFEDCPEVCRGSRTTKKCPGNGPHRVKENVRAVSAFVLDLDEAFNGTQRPVPVFGHFWYESFGSSLTAPRWRIVLPFAEDFFVYHPDDWSKGARPALIKGLGFDGKIKADRSCRDPGRLYHLPRHPEGETRAHGEDGGEELLDWHAFTKPAGERPAVQVPAQLAAPSEPLPPIDLARIREGLERIQAPEWAPIAKALLAGKSLTPPPATRPPGGLPRREAWRIATVLLANIACEDGRAVSPEALTQILQPTYESMVADDPQDHTSDETIVGLLQDAIESAPEAAAEKAAARERNDALFFATFSKSHGHQDPKGDEEGATEAPFDMKELRWKYEDGSPTHPTYTGRNCSVILERTSEWRGALRFNELSGKVELHGGPCLVGPPRPLRDEDAADTADWFSEAWEMELKDGLVWSRMLASAQKHAYNPLKDYLNGLAWDGVPRIANAFVRYFHSEDNAFTRQAAQKWFISAVARGLDPGCQVDSMLVLEGVTSGEGKTSALRILGGPFFSGSPINDVHDKDARIAVTRHWFQEMGELTAHTRSAVEAMKDFISRREEDVRLPYARCEVTIKRPCILVATTNMPEYLQDEGRNRKYWPVACNGKLDLEGLAHDRDQLFAEAVALYQAAPKPIARDSYLWWFDETGEALAAEETEKRRTLDAAAEAITEWFLGKAPKDRPAFVTAHRVLEEVMYCKEQRFSEKRIAGSLGRLGFKSVRTTVDKVKYRGFVPPAELLEAAQKGAKATMDAAAREIATAHLNVVNGGKQ